jgi:hypothetical protein
MDKQKRATWLRWMHFTLMIVWVILTIPTATWWANSVRWVGLISCYANSVGHMSAWQGARAEREANSNGNSGSCPHCGHEL